MAGRLMMLSEPARRLTFAFAESKRKLTATFVVATLLQTRAPMGKRCGPLAGLLLSRPMTFQVIGVTVSVAFAAMGAKMKAITSRAERFDGIGASPLFSCRFVNRFAAGTNNAAN